MLLLKLLGGYPLPFPENLDQVAAVGKPVSWLI